jgi:TolB-like protein
MKALLIIFGLTLVVGCARQPEQPSSVVTTSERSSRLNTAADYQLASVVTSPAENQPMLTANEYSRALVHELMSSQRQMEEGGMVGVTDFAFVDTGLDQGSVLSNHMSEAMIYDLHKFGVPVLDYKATDFIRVTPSGDFALSRDFTELSGELPIRYVVTGTMTAHKQGVLVNARLIHIGTKQVIAAARTFMPQPVVQAIIKRSGNDKLQLKQG